MNILPVPYPLYAPPYAPHNRREYPHLSHIIPAQYILPLLTQVHPSAASLLYQALTITPKGIPSTTEEVRGTPFYSIYLKSKRTLLYAHFRSGPDLAIVYTRVRYKPTQYREIYQLINLEYEYPIINTDSLWHLQLKGDHHYTKKGWKRKMDQFCLLSTLIEPSRVPILLEPISLFPKPDLPQHPWND